jgi:hypothetical protein
MNSGNRYKVGRARLIELSTARLLRRPSMAVDAERAFEIQSDRQVTRMLRMAVLDKRPDLDEGELVDILSSNLCRCTGYANIIKAGRAGAAVIKARA